jgi:mono/diheme cytochrome c family protein
MSSRPISVSPRTARRVSGRSPPDTTAATIDRYLSRGHTLMPDFSLSTPERDALVAYILSLR